MAVVQIRHDGCTMGRSTSAKRGSALRQRLIRWMKAHPKEEIVTEITQLRGSTSVRLRPITRAVVKDRVKARLNPLQEQEMQTFLEALALEFGLRLSRNRFCCPNGYAWVIFTLTPSS